MRILQVAATGALIVFNAAAAAQGAAPTDPQIAAIVVTANQVDIDAGKLAEGKSANNDVKEFARLMVKDHGNVNKAATDLAKKLKLTPEDNPTAQSLKQGGDSNIAKLKTLSGKAFDRAYVDNEVTYHQAVLDALDKSLVPNAKDDELRALMVNSRPAFVAHLQHAKLLQSRLGQ
jgi:putative membrane protein